VLTNGHPLGRPLVQDVQPGRPSLIAAQTEQVPAGGVRVAVVQAEGQNPVHLRQRRGGDDVPGGVPHVVDRTSGDHPQPVNEPFTPQANELTLNLRDVGRVEVLVVCHAELEDPVPELASAVHDLPLHEVRGPVRVGCGEDLRTGDT